MSKRMRWYGIWMGCGLLLLGAAARAPIPAGGIGGTGIAQGGIGGTGITAVGVIQRFGSIFVNGTEYQLTPATRYWQDGVRTVVTRLQQGDTVQVEARSQKGTSVAVGVRVQHALEGKVTAVAGRRVRVLGLWVHIGRTTIIAQPMGRSAPIQVGQWVAVSGFMTAHDAVYATRVAVTRVSVHPDPSFLIRGLWVPTGVDGGRVDGQAFRLARSLGPFASFSEPVVAEGVYRHGKPVVTRMRPAASLVLAGYQRVVLAGYITRYNDALYYGAYRLIGPAVHHLSAHAVTSSAVVLVGMVRTHGRIAVMRVDTHIDVMRFGLGSSRRVGPNRPRIHIPRSIRMERPPITRPPVVRPSIHRSIGYPP